MIEAKIGGEQMALRILIVEDEESLASFIQTELTFEGTTQYGPKMAKRH